MIKITHGNLLKAPAEALVNTVNTVGVMGKGIALQFKNSYPQMYEAYADACKAGRVQLGRVHVFDLGGLADGPRWIINFPTKGHWRAASRLQDVAAGLQDLVETVRTLGIQSIAVPPLGCGYGGLQWGLVRPLIEQAFAQLPEVQVLLYPPEGAPEAVAMARPSAPPKMTESVAILVALMHRYLQGLLDPFVSLLEVQKLMYFMQEAGHPLKLKYETGKFGPFAANLGHVLKRVEGYYITGYGDGHAAPDKPLELLDDAAGLAAECLARNDAVMKRIERVTRLIEGYEDRYGMELLSTMHWVMVHNEVARQDCEAAIELVQAWSERKARELKPHHLARAWQRLKEQEWDFMACSIEHTSATC